MPLPALLTAQLPGQPMDQPCRCVKCLMKPELWLVLGTRPGRSGGAEGTSLLDGIPRAVQRGLAFLRGFDHP